MRLRIPRLGNIMKLISNKDKGGCAVHIGGMEHTRAAFTRQGSNVDLAWPDTIESEELRKLGRSGTHLFLCFSPRLIYADTGEFSNVSPEATTAHIYSAVDKLRLFREDYRIAYVKIGNVDATKSAYSYMVVPNSEADVSDLLDEDNTLVDVLCPVEAALTAALTMVDREMAIVVLEDSRFIRLVGAKDGVVYYLITVNVNDSFDPLVDTVAGINEMTSLLMNTYREKVGNIYLVDESTITQDGLAEQNVESLPFPLSYGDDQAMINPVLIGTASQMRYNFTSERLRATNKLTGLAKISAGISLGMLAIAAVFILLGFGNLFSAHEYDESIRIATRRSAGELARLEKDYTMLSKSLDLAHINPLMQTYKEFQAEPKLPAIVNAISQKIPPAVFLTKIEIKRPSASDNPQPGQVEAASGNANRPAQITYFDVIVEGVINVPYPRSRDVFSGMITTMQGRYGVGSATYSHKQDVAMFSVKMKVKI